MKIFTNKKIFNKIAIILVIVMACSFIIPNNISRAETFQKDDEGNPGGKMLSPIMDLLMFIGDGILGILQNNFLTTSDMFVQANSKEASTVNVWSLLIGLGAVIAIALGIVFAIPTGGVSLAAAGKICIGAVVVIAGSVTAHAAFSEFASDLSGEFDIPIIQYTPYTIFSGQIPALDINFISPMETKYETETKINTNVPTDLIEKKDEENIWDEAENNGFLENDNDKVVTIFSYSVNGESSIQITAYGNNTTKLNKLKKFAKNTDDISDLTYKIDDNENLEALFNIGLIVKDGDDYRTFTLYEWTYNNEDWGLIAFDGLTKWSQKGSHETIGITSGDSKNSDESYTIKKEYKSSATILRNSIATWYKVLRTVALVGLLSVLIYIGIRILFTSVAADKAKYKKMLIDWVTAICILFILHYLMVLILTVSSKLTEIFIPKASSNLIVELPEDTKVNGKLLTDLLKNENVSTSEEISKNVSVGTDGKANWVGDYVGYIRLIAGVNTIKNATVYGLMYLVLVIYTCMFTFMYLKRTLYMAFLTMIAPLIALTYPLDKIKDGKAQAFGLWIREYIFNALIQPVHLILYTMVLSTVLDLAVEHPVYALVALGFFTPAERFIRKMFGFENAGTISALGQMAGGAAVMSAINKMSRLNKRKKKDEEEGREKPVRTKEEGGFSLPFGGGENGTADNGQSGANNPLTGGRSNPTNNTSDENISQNGTNSTPQYDSRLSQEQREEMEAEGIAPGDQEYSNMLRQYGITPENNGTDVRTVNRIPTEGDPDFIGPPRPQKEEKERFRTKLTRGMGRVGDRYRKKLLKAKPLRATGKFVGMGLGAITLGTAGLAAGIATGDPSKVISYTAAAGGIGGALGKTTAENIMDEGSEIKENFQKGYQGEQEYINKKLDKEYYNGTAEGGTFQDMLEQKDLYSNLQPKERAKKMKEDIQIYRKSGITDNNQIATCMRAGLSPEHGVYAVQTANAMEKSGWNNKNIYEGYKKGTRDILIRQKGLTPEEADKIWETVPKILF